MNDFELALKEWEDSAKVLTTSESEYACAYGRAIETAEGKTQAIRDGIADRMTVDERAKRDTARVFEQSAKFRVQYLIRRAGPDSPI